MWQCPKCKSTSLQVAIMTTANLIQSADNFETEIDGDHEFDAESPMTCQDCGHSANAWFFNLDADDCRTVPEYVVRWEVDQEADNPRMAAQDAADAYFQSRIRLGEPDTACVFTVVDSLTGETTKVDLANPE